MRPSLSVPLPLALRQINAVADMAMSLYKHYKLVVHSLEKYVRRSTRDTRLFGLYVIDALLRRSRAKFGEGPRDIFATRLAINMLLTFAKLIEVRSFDLPRVHKILQSWRAKNIFSSDLQDEMEAIFESAKDGANPDDDDDDDEDERKRQHMEGDASPVPPTGDESPVDFEQPQPAAHVASAVPAPYAAAPRAAPPGGSRDPRRAAHAAAASSASQSFPPPPAAAPAASASDPTLAALANLQSMLATPAPAAAAPVPMPVVPVAPAAQPAAVLPVAPLPPPPAVVAEDDWGYDDEDEEDEDEEARKEKLRVRLEQEKARMEAAQIDLPAASPAAQTPTSLTTPQDPFGHMQFPPLAPAAAPAPTQTQPPAAGDASAPAAAPARRSRFGAPKSKEEVEASLAAAAPALLHSNSAASGGSYERRGPTSPPAERRRSRSRSRERDQQRSSYQQSGGGGGGGGGGASSSISISGPNNGGGGGGGGGNHARLPRDAQSPGFVRLPDSEQVGTSWVRVLSTTLRVGHAPLSSLGLDPAELRTTLKDKFSVFGQVDWLNPTEKQSYVRFRTRRDACMAKAQAHPMQIGGAPARLHWAKAREMDQEMFNQLSGEGAVEAGSAVLQRTPVEAPDLDVDDDFRDKRRGRGGAGAGGAGGASEGRGGAAQSSGPESYPVTGWTQPTAAAVPGASPYGTATQQTQAYPHAMAFLAQQPMQQQQQQQQQAYAEQAPTPASGPYVHPSRPWMQQ